MLEQVLEIVRWLKTHSQASTHLQVDSRCVQAGDIFVALPGRRSHGRDFMHVAVAQGAAAVLLHSDGQTCTREVIDGVAVLAVSGLTTMMARVAAQYYGEPARQMTGIAVTGTNGKTTSSQWCAQLLDALGKRCAVLGTIGTFFRQKKFPAPSLTTPDVVSLQGLYADLVHAGARYYAIEASSAGLRQGRLAQSAFDVAIYTNLTRDHLDYHGTMRAYAKAKAILMQWPGLKHAVINNDDAYADFMKEHARVHGVKIWGYSANGLQDRSDDRHIWATDLKPTAEGQSFLLHWNENSYPVHVPIVGHYNVENLLGVIAGLLALGFSVEAIIRKVQFLKAPAGRLEVVAGGMYPMALVDYAHTPDAMRKLLRALRPLTQVRGGKLWIIFGCGGDRDRGKRPIMVQVAQKYADCVVITSDNPRTEDPQQILEDMKQGLTKPATLIEMDRAKAIEKAIAMAAPRDVLVITGKGHETYQEIQGVRYHFSDQEEVQRARQVKEQA